MSDLVERVAKAAMNEIRIPCDITTDATAAIQAVIDVDVLVDRVARAAIAEVLDAMREQAEGLDQQLERTEWLAQFKAENVGE